MGDLPVATLRPNGSSVTIYYVHSDHLGTPRKITNPTGNTVVWRWDPDTFGSGAPSITTISYNLRFPGQYFLTESGLFYNYFGDYDPTMGRYIESDPIGLAGLSWSTYAYVGGNPVSSVDPSGLLVAIVGSSPAAYAQLQAAYDTVGGTQRGAELINILETSTTLYTITDTSVPYAGYSAARNTITINPNRHPYEQTACKSEAAPTAVILGHEIGHAATGFTDTGPDKSRRPRRQTPSKSPRT